MLIYGLHKYISLNIFINFLSLNATNTENKNDKLSVMILYFYYSACRWNKSMSYLPGEGTDQNKKWQMSEDEF